MTLGAAATAAVPAIGAGFMSWAVRGRSSSLFAPSIYRGPRDRPVLALTFDDGPSESTPELLEILARDRVLATFFVCGRNVARLPGVTRAVLDAGHEIGNHTQSHARLWLRTRGFIFSEIAAAQQSITEATGAAPRWFRAPFGARWFGLRETQRRLGLTGVMWTALGHDWKRPAAVVVERLIRGASNGAILCLHDGRALQPRPDIRETLDAVRRAVPMLIDRGFQFQTISQILCMTTN